MRCLTLANTLTANGAAVSFVAATMPDALAERVRSDGHEVRLIPAAPDMQRDGPNWEEPPLRAGAQRADAAATGAAGPSDWLITDHYLLGAEFHAAARSFARRIFVIDDLANRSLDCDLLLDQTLGRSAEAYRALVPAGCTILAGSQFAMLRPEFVLQRPAALERRKAAGPVESILVSMGATDPDGNTLPVVEQLLEVAPDCRLDVVLGPGAASLEGLRALEVRAQSVRLHVNTDRMADLMRDADLAIGAAGMTSWERCCLGLPVIALVMADNQRTGAMNLEAVGAAVVVDQVDAIAPAVAGLLSDPSRLARMSAAAFAVVDGRGADRVAAAMLDGEESPTKPVGIRPARIDDSERIWLWRNDPLMRAMAKSREAIGWAEHEHWFDRVLRDTATELYIADLGGEPAAMVRFDREDGQAIVSINVAPELRGRGVGTAALVSSCAAFERAHPDTLLSAEIRHQNRASKRAFRAAGFEEMQSEVEGYSAFRRHSGGECLSDRSSAS